MKEAQSAIGSEHRVEIVRDPLAQIAQYFEEGKLERALDRVQQLGVSTERLEGFIQFVTHPKSPALKRRQACLSLGTEVGQLLDYRYSPQFNPASKLAEVASNLLNDRSDLIERSVQLLLQEFSFEDSPEQRGERMDLPAVLSLTQRIAADHPLLAESLAADIARTKPAHQSANFGSAMVELVELPEELS